MTRPLASFRSFGWTVPLLTACAPIRYSQQEVLLRHEPMADELHVLILYDQIQSAPQSEGRTELAVGGQFAGNVAAGKREFMIFDWPFHHDLDKLQGEVEGEIGAEADPWTDWRREIVGCLRGITVENSGFYRGELNRLSLYQHFRLADSSELIGLANRALHMWIEDCMREGRFQEKTPWLDARSRELWRGMARERTTWLSLSDGSLTVELPLTGSSAATILAELTKASGEDLEFARFLAGLSSALSDLQASEERIRFRWNLTTARWRFLPPKDFDYDSTLVDKLQKSEGFPATLPLRDEVLRRFAQ